MLGGLNGFTGPRGPGAPALQQRGHSVDPPPHLRDLFVVLRLWSHCKSLLRRVDICRVLPSNLVQDGDIACGGANTVLRAQYICGDLTWASSIELGILEKKTCVFKKTYVTLSNFS